MKTDKLNMLENIDEKYITEASEAKNTYCKRVFATYVSIAACAALALAIGVSVYRAPSPNTLPLSTYSFNVKVEYYNGDVSKMTDAHSLAYFYSAEEAFAKAEAVLRGTVTDIRNIEINSNGIKEYRALATVTVENVYLGSCKAGDVVTIMLPCPISEGQWVEDTDVVAQMSVGKGGIFLLKEYGNDDYYSANNSKLLLSDVADYGFSDGVQFAFVETENGLVFDKEKYEEVANATSLDEVEKYVIKMIK